MIRRWLPALVVVLVAGCTTQDAAAPDPVVVPTLAPTSGAPAASTTTPAPVLPANCGAMISGNQLDVALGKAVSATVDVVVGEPQPDIARTGRTTCRYGTPTAGTYPLVVSLSSYDTATDAADRVTATVTSGEQEGVGSSTITAGGADGRYIPFPSGGLVVASSGIYSVAVTIAPKVLAATDVAPRAAKIAGIVLAAAGV